MSMHTSPERLNRDPPGHPGHPGQRPVGCGGILGQILRRVEMQPQLEQEVAVESVVAEPSPVLPSEATPRLSGMDTSIPDTAKELLWDDARALAVQGAVHARLDQVIAALPADSPHRQARLRVLENERGIVAKLMAKHDPQLWGWLRSLECLLQRCARMTGKIHVGKPSDSTRANLRINPP